MLFSILRFDPKGLSDHKGLSRTSKNMKGAFSQRHPEKIKGRKILVVDDVYTTGATVNECDRVLMKAGAEFVDVLTLARAV